MTSEQALEWLAGLKVMLEELRWPHVVVEGDCWFSCPKSGKNCNEDRIEACDCGADAHNAKLDAMIAALG